MVCLICLTKGELLFNSIAQQKVMQRSSYQVLATLSIFRVTRILSCGKCLVLKAPIDCANKDFNQVSVEYEQSPLL